MQFRARQPFILVVPIILLENGKRLPRILHIKVWNKSMSMDNDWFNLWCFQSFLAQEACKCIIFIIVIISVHFLCIITPGIVFEWVYKLLNTWLLRICWMSSPDTKNIETVNNFHTFQSSTHRTHTCAIILSERSTLKTNSIKDKISLY